MIGDQVSFNYFKNSTRKRRVHYSVSYTKQDITTKKQIPSFMIYPEYTDGVLSNIFISKFIMGRDVKFYKIGNNTFKAIHENYEAIFEILEDSN